MFGKIARATFLVVLGLMVVSWAVSVGRSSPADQPNEQWTGRMYS